MAKPVIPDWGSEDEGSLDFESSDEELVWEVDRILAERKFDGATQYLVKWKDFEAEDCTWEPANSFTTTLTLSVWEKARDQGDTLDASELQNVEQKMARHQAENEKEEAARLEMSMRKPARQIPSNVRGPIEKTSIIKHTSARDTATPPLPMVPVKRKASPLLLSNAKAESLKPVNPKAPPSILGTPRAPPIPISSQVAPADQKQSFHTLGSDSRDPGRRTTRFHSTLASNSRAGQPFRNLSHQNNAQKLRKQEPAPNINQLGTLRPLTDLPPMHDVALNLPSGPRPLHLARNPTQEAFMDPTEGELERVPEPIAIVTSPERSTTGSTGLESRGPEPPLHQQISHAMFQSAPSPNQSTFSIKYGNQFFDYRWGELVVQMTIGTRIVGHVKVVGLLRPGASTSPLITAILRTRDDPVLGMTFAQEDANNLQDYRWFEPEVSATGSLEPYDNAKDAFYELLTFFNTHSKAVAVWRHDLVPWTMVAYSSRAAAFVEKGFPSVSGGLAFIVCRRVPWCNAPLPATRVQPPPRNDNTVLLLENGIHDSGSNSPMEIDPSSVAALPVEASHVSQTMTGLESTNSVVHVNDRMPNLDPRQAEATNEIPVIKKQPGLEYTKTEGLPFEKKYGVTYENLTRIPPTVKPLSENGKFNRQIVSFFLAFAEGKRCEEVLLKRWLTTRTPAYMIYSSSEDHAWDRYKLALHAGDQVGIILIHDDFVLAAFRIMKGLAKQIRRENMQIFRVSLECPLRDLSLRNFGRIFPSGLVVLITESTFFDNAAGTADLLNWFAGKIKAKPNWRLFLRPQPQDYLRDLCETDISKEDRSSHEKSLILLEERLQPPPSTTSPPLTSPRDDADSSSCVLAPLSLPMFSNGDEESSLVTSNTKKIAERDVKLVNFFCGWAFDQVSNFRRFVAITANMSEDIRQRNSHVDFLTLAEFEKWHMLKTNPTKLRTPGDSPMSPVVKSAVLKQT